MHQIRSTVVTAVINQFEWPDGPHVKLLTTPQVILLEIETALF